MIPVAMVLVFLAGVVLGMALHSRFFVTRELPEVQKPTKQPEVTYGYEKLDRKKLHKIHDHAGVPWYLLRYGTSGVKCVPADETWPASYATFGREWYSGDEKWFSWEDFQKAFPEHADLGPAEVVPSANSVELTDDELSMLADYRKAREELEESIRA